jgi:hypothetical protein
MSLLARLESKFGRYAVPNLTVFLIVGQVLAYAAGMAPAAPGRAPVLDSISLVPDKVFAGEWWRVVTFLFDPPRTNAIFAFFAWYLFYLMGTSLEATWGAFRYNIYLAIGYWASLAAAFLAWFVLGGLGLPADNVFLYGSVFLAFARFYPEFVLNLMFILPVKIKWLAWLMWAVYAWNFVTAPTWLPRMMIVAAVLNYLLFFGRDIWRGIKHSHRRMRFQARTQPGRVGGKSGQIVHTCRICGLTSKDSPRTPFRYCTKCDGDCCYCLEHLDDHEHVLADRGQESGVGGQGSGRS